MTIVAAGINTFTFPSLHSLALLQAQDAINSGNSKLLMIFVGLVAFALLVQAVVMVVLAIGGMKAQKELMGHVEEIKAKLLPFVKESHGLVTDLTPQVKHITSKVQTLITDLSPEIVGITTKVHSITGHVEEISSLARDKVAEFGPTLSAANRTALQTTETVRATVLDANDKTRAQVDRVNSMISGALDATAKIGRAIEHGITQPAREVSGFVSGAKITLEHLYKSYGGIINLSGLASMVGLGKKTPSPYAAAKPATHAPVAPHKPAGMGTNNSGLPSAFGSTRRDLDL